MGRYTNYFEEKSFSISYEDDYIDEIKNTLNKFRTFAEALDSFIVKNGFEGDLNNIGEKVSFITYKCKCAGVPVPRNLKSWYTDNIMPERTSKNPFYLCFAFRLSVDEANEFLRKICLFRGFDCHNINEIVYFYALKNGMDFHKATEILSKVESEKLKKIKIVYTNDIVNTDLIVRDIEEIETEDELIDYLNQNIYKFQKNNVTAYELIQREWEKIIGNNNTKGIALKEKQMLYSAFDKDESCVMVSKGVRKERKRADDSIWEIFLQILGLSGNYMAEFYAERSLKFILEDNDLLHPMVQYCFPDRDGLNKVLNGVHLSHERVRKLIILLLFYTYFANEATRKNSYYTDEMVAERFICEINDNLIFANYPALYPANPYDFLIFTAIRSEYPLITFRDYMRELYFEKLEILED